VKISTRSRYALRMLVDLTIHYEDQPITLKEISQRQEISLYYLQHLITPLINGGIILTARGTGGGVSLFRSPDDVYLSEVLRLLDGPIAPTDCVINPEICHRSTTCVIRNVWCDMKAAIDRILEATNLQELARQQRELNQS